MRGYIGLGMSVRPPVSQVHPTVMLFSSWETPEPLMPGYSHFICGMYMTNKRTRIFYSAGLIVLELSPFVSYVIFYMNNLGNKISEEPLRLGY